MKKPEQWAWPGISAATLIGMIMIGLSTRWGPGVGGDATIYMTSASNLLAGNGLGLIEADGSFRLLPYSAPFLPLVLAGARALGFEMAVAARWLNLLLFGGLIALTGGVVLAVTRSAVLSFCAALLLAVSPILTPVYSWAMAEPLTLMTGFGGLWLMARQIERPEKYRPLLLSAFLTGLAALTRYSGAAFAAAAGLGWLALSRTPWGGKIRKGLLFGLVAAFPSLVWVGVQLSQTSGVASRSMEETAIMAGRLAAFWPQLGEVLLSWLLPVSWIDAPSYPGIINLFLTWVLAILVIGMLVYFLRGKVGKIDAPLQRVWPVLLSIFILVYAGVIFATYLATYPPITLDNRMFSPLHIGVLMLIPLFLSILCFKKRDSLLRFAPYVILAAFALWYGWRDVRIVQQNFHEGLGYNSLAWRSSELINWVEDTPPDTTIVTNETMAVLFLTGRTAYPLAEIYADTPGDVHARYGSSTADPGQAAFARGAVPLVLFDSIADQFESIYGDRTPERIEALTSGLDVVFSGDDGTVFVAP